MYREVRGSDSSVFVVGLIIMVLIAGVFLNTVIDFFLTESGMGVVESVDVYASSDGDVAVITFTNGESYRTVGGDEVPDEGMNIEYEINSGGDMVSWEQVEGAVSETALVD